MTEAKAGAWTDAEKLSLLFQIIDKGGPIPYDDLVLPEGRTKKAVQVMLGRERAKAKGALDSTNVNDKGSPEADGEKTGKPAGPKKGKRKAKDEAEGAPKKTKAPRKKKAGAVTAGPDGDDDEAPAVKAEPEGDDMAF